MRMRYVLYLLTLALVFTAGMVVGNFYIPSHTESMSVAVSLPELNSPNPVLQKITEENAQQALASLEQGLSACPVVVAEEKDSLFNRISLYLALQDFLTKKAIYEAEIAKNIETSRTTAQFSKAAADYTTAKTYTEQLADTLFPQTVTVQPAVASSATANVMILPSSSTVAN